MAETLQQYEHRYLNDPSEELFVQSKVQRLANEGENNFAVDYPCIIKRVSLQVVSGQKYVALPDDVKSIRRVTWKGWKMDPLPQRNFREVFQNATQVGRPFWYVFNNVGQNIIQLFPAANENMPVGTGGGGFFDSHTGDFDSATGDFDSAGGGGGSFPFGGDFDSMPGDFDSTSGFFDTPTGGTGIGGTNITTGLYGVNIPNCFIVEYFQVPDYVNAVIPNYFRRRLLKSYVLRGCFNIEGQGQNMKASKYFKEKWRALKEQYGLLLGDLYNKPRKLVVNGISSSYYFPGNPLLPIDKFGTSVDAGE